jgi:hypothetical protein
MLPFPLSTGLFDTENEKISEEKGCRDLVWNWQAQRANGTNDAIIVATCMQSLGKPGISSQAGTEDGRALLLVWWCTERLGCTYGQLGIVKHDAGTLRVSRITNSTPNMFRVTGGQSQA